MYTDMDDNMYGPGYQDDENYPLPDDDLADVDIEEEPDFEDGYSDVDDGEDPDFEHEEFA